MRRRSRLPKLLLPAKLRREGKPWPLCPDYPECLCARAWLRWQEADWSKLTTEQLDRVASAVFTVLQCLAATCPDLQFARNAKAQLQHPIFRRVAEEQERWLAKYDQFCAMERQGRPN
jgi:hypothetical protein